MESSNNNSEISLNSGISNNSRPSNTTTSDESKSKNKDLITLVNKVLKIKNDKRRVKNISRDFADGSKRFLITLLNIIYV